MSPITRILKRYMFWKKLQKKKKRKLYIGVIIASCVHCIWHELPTYAKTSVDCINNITVLRESPLNFVVRKGIKKGERDRCRGKRNRDDILYVEVPFNTSPSSHPFICCGTLKKKLALITAYNFKRLRCISVLSYPITEGRIVFIIFALEISHSA